METLQLLGVALGLATMAGINLYLTVCLTGLAIRYNWIFLDERFAELGILAHPAIITIAGILYLLEFFADKVPWVDSVWDSIHTFIRPIGGTFLAIQALGDADPVFSVIVAMMAAGMSLTTHSIKAGTRVVVNSSPEPVSNIALSVVEDVSVVGGLWLIYADPVLALVIFAVFIVAAFFFLPKMFRSVKLKIWLAWQKLQAPPFDNLEVELPSKLSPDADVSYHVTKVENEEEVSWALPCISGKSKEIPPYVEGYLIATDSNQRVYFLSRKRSKIAKLISLDGYKVSHESKFLSENLTLYPLDKQGPRYTFIVDRTQQRVMDKAKIAIEKMLESTTPVIPEEKPEPVKVEKQETVASSTIE